MTICATQSGRFAVLDFETNGMSPPAGARATEIGIVLLEDGRIVDRYQSLMNAGAWIPPFIEELTGISNVMVGRAPPADTVMREAADFVGDLPLVAHNAGFDSRFWDAELARIGRVREAEFACSMLLARRVFPDAPSHKLGTLVDYANLPVTGRFHRAMADAEMTAHLVARLCEELAGRFGLDRVPHALLCRIQRVPRGRMASCVAELSGAC
jgi:DNA polymerase-3 subunit epsilon